MEYTKLVPITDWIYPGDVVTFATTGDTVYRVTKTARVNATCQDENGKLWRMNMRGLKKTDQPFVLSPVAEIKAENALLLRAGEIVRFKPGGKAYAREGRKLFVVIGVREGGRRVSVEVLGGGIGGGWRTDSSSLTLVPAEDVLR